MHRPWKVTPLSELPIRDDLRGLSPYGAPQLECIARLNVNENPYAPSPELVRSIAEAVSVAVVQMNRYPDREFLSLRTELANYLSSDTGEPLQANNIWAANGSNEILQQLLQVFGGPGRKAMVFTPAYAMYEEYCRNSLTQLISVEREQNFTLNMQKVISEVEQHLPHIIILTSPNNPTGTALELSEIESILNVAPGIVVVDEAYGEFRRNGKLSAVNLLPEFPNLVVCRTMSKAFAFAGGRLGYCASGPSIVDAIKLTRLPYHLSSLTQAAARAALAGKEELLSKINQLKAERDFSIIWLREQGLIAADSDANFILFGQFSNRRAVWEGLIKRGVLIREVGPESWLRVSIGTSEEMQLFRNSLVEVLAEVSAPLL
ncbi:histidinol-phosphate transaminase [Pseudomonas sp. FP1742]|uniref:histidinol-phosphate transaminase n=1 Tax=Pseudomonas sp. FP1742 TaxID=2954079 RepID=UPI0027376FC1|nr:histidinol-phosphate transaminase [Pseudomonas sp. FP1742]WLG48872.1 histidinol-phosphate transaminase [Pseudomonas sp. FP1742]